ncbi:hypothetical protein, partial [Halolactibacillus sp. JCM 19043]|uniref:hypothetical protein n=1 Tax=Halolactibacillus sp. JCM 19043 TaxID=1460638 RepID=UPI0018D0FBE6
SMTDQTNPLEISVIHDDDIIRTEDTQRILKDGDGAFYIEGACEWYDSWLRMVISCYKCGMTKEEIKQGLDIESDEFMTGYMYWTEYQAEN